MSKGEPDVGIGNSVIVPLTVTRAMEFVFSSVNQRFPSGPSVITSGWLLALGIRNDRRFTCREAGAACTAVDAGRVTARKPSIRLRRITDRDMMVRTS